MKLKFINKIQEARDTYSFFFVKPENFTFEAGQYLVLKIKDQERQLTIASSPTENQIQITTRIRKESEFKQGLNNLKVGDQIETHGPFGTFTIINNQSSIINNIFLAGGIGITPFRSFIKYNLDKNLKIPMFLIYSNSDDEFVFKKELDQWQKEKDFLKIEYINSSAVGRIDKMKIVKLIGNKQSLPLCGWKLKIENCAFSAVGPKMYVNSIEDILEELKIPQDHIKTEKFIGY